LTDVLLYDALPDTLRQDISNGLDRSLCLKCDGGRSRERSLSIRPRDDGVISLRCWRASCSWYALTMTDPNARLQTKQLKPPQVYRDAILPLNVLQERIEYDYGCDIEAARHHGWGENADGSQLVMPIRAPYSGLRGHVTRTFTEPKRCFTFKATAQPWLDWWWHEASRTTVIVEDCISALRLYGLGYNAVALLGTNISVEQAKELAEVQTEGLVLALDRDAFEKSLKLTKRLSHVVTMRPICLDEDIKNIKNDSDIHALFTG
jgi:hypothetical protein